MKKFSKKVLATALVLTLAVPSAITFAADGKAQARLPKPLAKITMQADNLAENGYTNVAGTEAVKDDQMGTVLKVSASSDTVKTEATFNNPFKGVKSEMSLQARNSELEEAGKLEDGHLAAWETGVTLNYWIKPSGTENSSVVTFRNNHRLQIHKDDWMHHMICVWAEEAMAKEKEDGGEVDPLFALSKATTYVDADNKEYQVYDTKSKFMNYRSDYHEDYYMIDTKGTITVKPKNPDADHPNEEIKIREADSNMYKQYYEWDHTKNPDSVVSYGYSDGFLQLSMDGGVGFMEDALAINTSENPNSSRPAPFINGNKLAISGTNADGDSDVMELLTPNEWHMVTVKIQNDYIEWYIDGEKIDMETSTTFNYGGQTGLVAAMAGSAFNGGFGLRFPANKTMKNRGETDTETDKMGNRYGALLVDWLGMDQTTFSVGGVITGTKEVINGKDTDVRFGASSVSQPESVAQFCIDDIAFYGEMLDPDQVESLYQSGLKKMQRDNPDDADNEVLGTGEVDDKPGTTASDALEVLKYAVGMTTLTQEQMDAADTNLDGNVDSKDALNILKFAVGMIDSLPVEE